MIDYIENEYAKYWIEKNILYFVYKDGLSIDLSIAIKVVEDRLFLQQGEAFLILCDMRGIKSINKSARNYLAVEGSVLIKAVALLINTPLTNAISGFYIKTSNPTIVTKAFTEKEDALKFLNSENP
ncbi:DUF7793 family protein [Flavivirga eckloniae]|uniref:DUF7793 domain-containing protein n=1 Tax=Flavivirga eckloniae TaxID=1803846 RepID=A0A2K9PNU0_9FLAO|nr:hypothetical protein [Flavivirga eckloniae]AUP78705.1 hypothetical protein C1H87_08290 [Flavivirga eckloniae]